MPSALSSGDLRAEIEAAVAAGRSFEEIDSGILAAEELAELDAENRDALWLYAWGCVEQAEDGRFVRGPAAVAAEHD
jgi:hypothetical protein